MSVRVLARIRPLSKSELGKDCILSTASSLDEPNGRPNVVKLPNPRNAAESYSFQFQSVYGHETSQQELFDNEISTTVKPLFNGLDVTIFAYGCTGSGKTHTMRGGKTLAERGIIPRLLSSVHRRARKIEKETNGAKTIEISMSYYEIYNDRVFDLFEPPEKRTAAGLPIRDNNGKTIVAGLSERPCTTLKEFEALYDSGNINRSTSATKLNAHSSRSHAVLCLKVVQTSEDQSITSTVSAIDLAGSEDNRRTENGKERLVESSSINKSLFVLAQCVEAISKKQARVPYRESKMTRILSLGQNNGLTIMILNLAPVRSYHLDTLSSLNFANRTKKIEVREVENEPIFKGAGKQILPLALQTGSSIQRQPLRPITTAANIGLKTATARDKPAKTFTVYAEKGSSQKGLEESKISGIKRSSDMMYDTSSSQPSKMSRTSDLVRRSHVKESVEISRADIEALVNQMVDEKLASRATHDSEKVVGQPISADLKRRLEALEQRVEQKEDSRTEGLQYLLMAKQHQVHGEDSSALKMYQLALPFFPDNEKLAQKMLRLQEKLRSKRMEGSADESGPQGAQSSITGVKRTDGKKPRADSDDEYEDADRDELGELEASQFKSKARRVGQKTIKLDVFRDSEAGPETPPSPRTQQLLRVINSRDLAQIKTLKGLGAKKAESIVNYICALDEGSDGQAAITSLMQLQALKGVGEKTVAIMRSGIVA